MLLLVSAAKHTVPCHQRTTLTAIDSTINKSTQEGQYLTPLGDIRCAHAAPSDLLCFDHVMPLEGQHNATHLLALPFTLKLPFATHHLDAPPTRPTHLCPTSKANQAIANGCMVPVLQAVMHICAI